MRQGLLVLLMLVVCGAAHGGAWPREEGRWFISASQNISHYSTGIADGYQSLYIEYGVTRKLTFGAKLWRRADRQYGDLYTFVSYPVSPPEHENKFALSLGFGARHYADGRVLPLVVPHFAWGRGFETPLMPGWMAVDLYLGHVFYADDGFRKADFTFGLKPDDKTHLILQLRTYEEPLGSVAIFAPSYVRQVTRDAKLELGLTYRMQERRRLGVIFGTWIEF